MVVPAASCCESWYVRFSSFLVSSSRDNILSNTASHYLPATIVCPSELLAKGKTVYGCQWICDGIGHINRDHSMRYLETYQCAKSQWCLPAKRRLLKTTWHKIPKVDRFKHLYCFYIRPPRRSAHIRNIGWFCKYMYVPMTKVYQCHYEVGAEYQWYGGL